MTGIFHLYTIKGCPFCENATELLDSYDLTYIKYEIKDSDKVAFKKINNVNSFPQVFYEKDNNSNINKKNKKIVIKGKKRIKKSLKIETNMVLIGGFADLQSFVNIVNIIRQNNMSEEGIMIIPDVIKNMNTMNKPKSCD
jgi:glutaredoxin